LKIQMIADPDRAIPDVNVAIYKKGCFYEVPAVLGALLVCEGWARPLPPHPVPIPTPIYTK